MKTRDDRLAWLRRILPATVAMDEYIGTHAASLDGDITKMLAEARGEPIPMRLACEGCGELHIDAGEFATKPHHTHACQSCGLVWRPAVQCTVGVRFLPGYKNGGAQ